MPLLIKMACILPLIKIDALRRCLYTVQTHKIEFKGISILSHQVIIKMFQMRKWANTKPWRYKYGLVVISIMLYHSKISIHLKIGYLNKIVTGFWENLKSGILWDFFEYPGGIEKFCIIFFKENLF